MDKIEFCFAISHNNGNVSFGYGDTVVEASRAALERSAAADCTKDMRTNVCLVVFTNGEKTEELCVPADRAETIATLGL